MEIYRKIKETKYSISNLGNVRNDITRKILKKNTHKKTGYEQITLRIDGKSKVLSVHRLVCLEFIPNPDNKKYVNHIDGNKTNNQLDNLEWVTASENMLHDYRVLNRMPAQLGISISEKAKLKISKKNKGRLNGAARAVKCITTGEIFDTLTEAANKYGLSLGNLSSACQGKLKSTGGKQWEYFDAF